MPRYIDADALKQTVGSYNPIKYTSEYGFVITIYDIDHAPTTDVVEIKKDGEWEMFDLISSAYYGKGMYFKEYDGTVYSRYSHKYISVYEAIREFISLIAERKCCK